MGKQIIFTISAAIVLIVGGISILGVLFFLGHYGFSHLIAAFLVFGTGVFFLVTSAVSEFSKYRVFLFYLPAVIVGVASTIHMVNGGAEVFVGYILVPLYVILLVEPFFNNDNKNA